MILASFILYNEDIIFLISSEDEKYMQLLKIEVWYICKCESL